MDIGIPGIGRESVRLKALAASLLDRVGLAGAAVQLYRVNKVVTEQIKS